MEKLEEYIKRHKENEEKADDLADYIHKLMDKHGFKKESEVYNKANISRQSWSTIITPTKSVPKLQTVPKIVFAMKLNNHECKYLLKKAGYTLPSSSKYALIIRYCIENKIYDLNIVNDYLMKNGFTKIKDLIY